MAKPGELSIPPRAYPARDDVFQIAFDIVAQASATGRKFSAGPAVALYQSDYEVQVRPESNGISSMQTRISCVNASRASNVTRP